MGTLITAFIVTSWVAGALLTARSWWRMWRAVTVRNGSFQKRQYWGFIEDEVQWATRVNWAVGAYLLGALLGWLPALCVQGLCKFITSNPPPTPEETRARRKTALKELERMEREAGIGKD